MKKIKLLIAIIIAIFQTAIAQVPCNANFTWSVNQSVIVAQADSITPPIANQYTWFMNYDTISFTVSGPVATFQVPTGIDSVYLCLFVSNVGCADTSCQVITIDTCHAEIVQNFQANGYPYYSLMSYSPASSYSWMVNTYDQFDSTTTSGFFSTQPNVYIPVGTPFSSVGPCLIATLVNGCQLQFCQEFNLDMDLDGYNFIVDCDDANYAINPGALEVCDGVDNNCDGFSLNSNDSITIYIVPDSLVVPLDSTQTIYLVFQYSGNPVITWTLSNGTIDSTAYPLFTNLTPGTYQICVNMILQSGCGVDTCLQFTIDSLGNWSRNVNWNLQIVPSYLVFGVKDITTNTTVMYPNPADDYFRVDGQNIQKVRIIQLDGKVVGEFNSNFTRIPVSDYNNGVYQIQVLSKSGVSQSKLVIKH